MRRVALAVAGTVVAMVLLLGFKTDPGGPRSALAGSVISGIGGTGTSGTGRTGTGTSGTGTAGGGTSGTGTSGARSGTVTGQAVQTRYGPVQVQVTFSSGRITAVQAVQMPGGDPRDDEITSFAAPILAHEAVQAQSAQIDVISGATYTSVGYAQSLQSAIDQARG